MAKGRCRKATVTIGKVLLEAVRPAGLRFIAETVELLSFTDWADSVKREAAVELAKANARRFGNDVRENAIRAAVEISVAGLKEGAETLSALGQVDDAEPTEVIGSLETV